MFKKILFPVDNSRETSHAISLVADLAQHYQSGIHVLSVLDRDGLDPSQSESSQAQIQGLLKQTESALRQVGLHQVTSEYREGKIPFVICDVADEQNMDLIIMGCRGLGLTEDKADDSVSTRVINLAPCPVLVVP
jgi:nucleotide-binding universal stress UspA family protein